MRRATSRRYNTMKRLSPKLPTFFLLLLLTPCASLLAAQRPAGGKGNAPAPLPAFTGDHPKSAVPGSTPERREALQRLTPEERQELQNISASLDPALRSAARQR